MDDSLDDPTLVWTADFTSPEVKEFKEFVLGLRDADPVELGQIILNKVGDNLSVFFAKYAQHVIEKDPVSAQSLILMGYLFAKENARGEARAYWTVSKPGSGDLN